MNTPALDDRIARERRRRLAAERLLAQKSDELFNANRKLASHADKLSDTVIEQREENKALFGEKEQVLADLGVATEQAGRAERRLWDSLEAISDGFAVFDKNWSLVAANRHYTAYFQDIEDVGLGAPYDLILQIAVDEGLIDIGPEDPEDWVDDMLARWEGETIPDMTLRLFDGRHIKVQDKRSSDGGVVSMITDITDTIEREIALRDARDAAETASRAKSAFLAKMSHEIRTPMNGVVGMADLLMEGGLDDENQLYAETIRNSGEALLVIINDILDFSKLEAEKMEFRPEPMDLEQLLLELLRLSETGTADKPLELVLDYPILGRTGFIADRGKLRQVLTNLIGNAIKFTPEGFVRVSVDIAAPNAEGFPIVKIAIEDSGIGIPEEKHDHVFEEFNQVEDEKNRRFEGTGLGLAITKALVERMGGTLTLESGLGQGSTFTIEMPLEPDPNQAKIAKPDLAIDTIGFIGGDDLAAAQFRKSCQLVGLTAVSFDPSDADADWPEALAISLLLSEDEQNSLNAHLPDHLPCIGIGLASRATEAMRSRFEAQIPWPASSKALRNALAVLKPESPEPLEKPLEKMRILAAEDNKTNQLVFRKMLKDQDIELTLVENGRLAVEAFLEVRPHLIFTDISMPEMDGMEATRAIRALEVDHELVPIPIIAMTAHAMSGDQESIQDVGIDHYLSKPLKKAILLEKLHELTPPEFKTETG